MAPAPPIEMLQQTTLKRIPLDGIFWLRKTRTDIRRGWLISWGEFDDQNWKKEQEEKQQHCLFQLNCPATPSRSFWGQSVGACLKPNQRLFTRCSGGARLNRDRPKWFVFCINYWIERRLIWLIMRVATCDSRRSEISEMFEYLLSDQRLLPAEDQSDQAGVCSGL